MSYKRTVIIPHLKLRHSGCKRPNVGLPQLYHKAAAGAEACRVVSSRILIAPDDWRRFLLFAIDGSDDLGVATFTDEQGDWSSTGHEILVERSAKPRSTLPQFIQPNQRIQIDVATPAMVECLPALIEQAPTLPCAGFLIRVGDETAVMFNN